MIRAGNLDALLVTDGSGCLDNRSSIDSDESVRNELRGMGARASQASRGEGRIEAQGCHGLVVNDRGIATLESGLEAVVNLGECRGTRVERLIFDEAKARKQRVGLVRLPLVAHGCVLRVFSVLVVDHAHEYSSGGTSSP